MGADIAAIHAAQQKCRHQVPAYSPVGSRTLCTDRSQGIINGTPMSEVRWIPGSDNLFLAAHMDGSLVIYDKEKEDALFSVDEEGAKENGDADGTNGAHHGVQIQIKKSFRSRNQRTNPVAMWKLSNQRINAFAFSPDNRHLAVVSEDGSFRIIDYLGERYVNVTTSQLLLGNLLTTG